MKLVSKVLFVLVCFAGAAASTPYGTSEKVQRFATPELCFLDVAANEKDALLVRAELQRREVACTSELRAEGQRALEQAVRLARLQATSLSLQRASAAREMGDRRETARLIRCATSNQEGRGECPDH